MNRYLFDATLIVNDATLHQAMDTTRTMQNNFHKEGGDIRIDMYYGSVDWDHEEGPQPEFHTTRDWGQVVRLPIILWVLATSEEEARRLIAKRRLPVVGLDCYDEFHNY